MTVPISRLNSVQVSNVMTPNVVELYDGEAMTQAVEVFIKHRISSAPVIDKQDRCVGMLSTVDVLTKQRDGDPTQNEVSRYMTSTVKSIAPDMPLLNAARIMHAGQIHRLPVLDTDGRVRGLVSTMDIVTSLLNLIEEDAS